jgi:protein-S-isoprenylcysteine O-methyltransferase Ste14
MGSFRVIVAVLLVGFVAHRGYYTRRINPSAKAVVERPQLGMASKVASLLALPALLSTLVYIVVPDWMTWSSLGLPDWLRGLGVAVCLAGFGLLQWAQQSLDRNWSDAPALFEQHTLITRGPYRWIRHPIYTAFLLIFGSFLIITSNWAVGLLWMLMTGLDVGSRVQTEERLMLRRFGARYRSYMNQTGRLVPRLTTPDQSAS